MVQYLGLKLVDKLWLFTVVYLELFRYYLVYSFKCQRLYLLIDPFYYQDLFYQLLNTMNLGINIDELIIIYCEILYYVLFSFYSNLLI